MGQRIDPAKRFDRLRKDTKQQVSSDVQQQQQALQRRFAKLGLTGSGAQIKAQQQAEQAGGERLDKALGQVASLEEGEALRRQEVQEGREFARGEREASQAFAAEQAGLGREFSRKERIGSQAFASGEAELQRRFSDSQRVANQEFQKILEAGAEDRFTRQLAQQADQFDRQFALDEEVTRFNQALAQAEANKKDLFERAGDAFGQFGNTAGGTILGSFVPGGAVPGAIVGSSGLGGAAKSVSKKLGF